MIAVDTNILARFYCEDPDDAEGRRQRPRARRVMIESSAVFVPLTVVLEFEWVMRGFYAVKTDTFCQPSITCSAWLMSPWNDGKR